MVVVVEVLVIVTVVFTMPQFVNRPQTGLKSLKGCLFSRRGAIRLAIRHAHRVGGVPQSTFNMRLAL